MYGITLSGKVLRNSAQRSTCSEQRDHLTRHVVTYKKWSFTSSSNYCERFGPRSHFISRLSMIVWVNLVLNRIYFY